MVEHKMILVSNHLQKYYVDLSKDAVIRVNMAWVSTVQELDKIIEDNKFRKVFLDYPQNRTKYPRPVLKLEDAYDVCARHPNVKYFAVSNVEYITNILAIKKDLPVNVEFVPKIETRNGIYNVEALINNCDIHTIMLDKEDLLNDLRSDNEQFFACVEHIRNVCKKLKVVLLELQGVVFVGE